MNAVQLVVEDIPFGVDDFLVLFDIVHANFGVVFFSLQFLSRENKILKASLWIYNLTSVAS